MLRLSVAMKLFILETSNPNSVETGPGILQLFGSTELRTYPFIHTHTHMHQTHFFGKVAKPKDFLWEADQRTAPFGEPSTSDKLTLL